MCTKFRTRLPTRPCWPCASTKRLRKLVLRAAGCADARLASGANRHRSRPVAECRFRLSPNQLPKAPAKASMAHRKLTDLRDTAAGVPAACSTNLVSRCSSNSFCRAANSPSAFWAPAMKPKCSARWKSCSDPAPNRTCTRIVTRSKAKSLVDYRLVRAADDSQVAEAERIALAAWRAVGGRDGGRIDLRCDATVPHSSWRSIRSPACTRRIPTCPCYAPHWTEIMSS